MSVYLMGSLYICTGVLHFIIPRLYIHMVPSYLPYPAFLVYLSGFFEILLGILLFFPAYRSEAAWGIILLLIAVFPANMYMAYAPKFAKMSPYVRWGRLPLQFLLIAWAWMYTH